MYVAKTGTVPFGNYLSCVSIGFDIAFLRKCNKLDLYSHMYTFSEASLLIVWPS